MPVDGESPWLVRYSAPPSRPRLRLFCIPFAGGNASLFRSFADPMLRDVDVVAVELPGRGRRMNEPALENIDAIVAGMLDAIASRTQTPYAIFGHSMGALVGFELIRALDSRGCPPPRKLIASAFRAPMLPDPRPPIAALPDPEFKEELRAHGGTPAEVLDNAELMELFLPLLRNDFGVCERYRSGSPSPLPCGVAVYGGLQDRHVSRALLEPWRTLSGGDFVVRMFPGDHFFIRSAQHLVIRALVRDLGLDGE